MKKSDAPRRLILLVICMAVAGVVIFLHAAPADNAIDNTAAKDYVIKNHIEDTSARNAVTAVYLNYRYWDTLFESLVLLLSALAVISLSWCSDISDKGGRRER